MPTELRTAAAVLAGTLLFAAGCERGEPMGPPAVPGQWAAPAFATPSTQSPKASWPIAVEAAVAEVVDGDTIRVRVGDQTESVRLIGIDTPETGAGKHAQPECGSAEATAFLQGLLEPGDAVEIRTDAQRRDRYGRLLGYVYRSGDGLFVNLEIAAAGHAEAMAIEPNTTWADEIDAATHRAQDEGLGLWGACAATAAG